MVDVFIASLFFCVLFICVFVYLFFKKQKDREIIFNYLSQIRRTIDRYPEMFIDKKNEIWVLDYLIQYYADEGEIASPNEMLNILAEKRELNYAKWAFLYRWVHYRDIINLDFATIELDTLKIKKT